MAEQERLKVSIVIPYFNADLTIQRTLTSIIAGRSAPEQTGVDYEVLVVDDGSDVPLTREMLKGLDELAIEIHRLDRNGGQTAACNAGFAMAKGHAVVVLDADDELAPDWRKTILALVHEWPAHSPLAFAWGITQTGERTGNGRGLYSREEWLSGRGRGEYLPVLRGHVAKKIGYIDAGCRMVCGTLAYGRILQDGPLYIHPEVMRIYHTDTPGSVSKHPFGRVKAADLYRCFRASRVDIEEYDLKAGLPTSSYIGDLYFREAVYQLYGVSRLRGLGFAWAHRRRIGVGRMSAVALVSVLPGFICSYIAGVGKRLGLIRPFG